MGYDKLTGLPVWRAAGLLAACLAAALLLRLPALSAGGSGGLPEAGGPGSGAEADRTGGADIWTPDGPYDLTGEVLEQLPPDSVQLGVLFQEGADSRTGLYAAHREHAGMHPVGRPRWGPVSPAVRRRICPGLPGAGITPNGCIFPPERV